MNKYNSIIKKIAILQDKVNMTIYGIIPKSKAEVFCKNTLDLLKSKPALNLRPGDIGSIMKLANDYWKKANEADKQNIT